MVNVNHWIRRIREVQDLHSQGGLFFVQAVKAMRLAYYFPWKKEAKLLPLLKDVDRTCEQTLNKVEKMKEDYDWWNDKDLWVTIEAMSNDGELSVDILRNAHAVYIQNHQASFYIDWSSFCGLFKRNERLENLTFRSYTNEINNKLNNYKMNTIFIKSQFRR